VGTYPIMVSGQTAPNYSITYVHGILTVTAASSSLALSSSTNPAVQGSNVVFTAALTAVAPGPGTPTGSVQFYTNGVASGSPVTLNAGTATASISTLPTGSNLVAGVYSGDANFLASSNAMLQVITAAVSDRPSTLSLTNNGDGTVTVLFQGAAGVQYVVQAKDDLISGNWLNVSTNIAPSNGFWTYTESTAGHPQRFYRSAKLAQLSARPAQPMTLSITNNANGTVTVKFRGTPGVEYVSQASADILPGHWTNVATNVASTDGFWTFTEAIAGHPTRFYRSALLKP